MNSFDEILAAWQGTNTHRNQLRAPLREGAWMAACQDAVKYKRAKEIRKWLDSGDTTQSVFETMREVREGGPFHAAQMRAYLLCAEASLADSESEREGLLEEASRTTRCSPAFYRDLLMILGNGEPLPGAADAQRIGTLLLREPAGEGRFAVLRLERVVPGTGVLYPAADLGFVYQDASFQDALATAVEYAQACAGVWRPDCDVRWSLDPIPPLAGKLHDRSMGAAFAVGLRFLFERPCDLGAYAISATVTARGVFGPVILREKLELALQSNRIEGVVVANSQQRLPPRPWAVPIYHAPSVDYAVDHLERLRSTRLWKDTGLFVGGAIATVLVASLVGLSSHYSYRLKFTAGHRLMVRTTEVLPRPRRRSIDTGFITADFSADAMGELSRGIRLAYGKPYQWATDVIRALSSNSTAARLLLRLGDRFTARGVAESLLYSSLPRERVAAAQILLELDPVNEPMVVPALIPLFSLPDPTGGLEQARLARVVAKILPSLGPLVSETMHRLVSQSQNNFVRADAVGALALVDPATIPFATGVLRPLLQDPNNLLRIKALQELMELDEDMVPEAIATCSSLLVDRNSHLRTNCFLTLLKIGVQYPDRVVDVTWDAALTLNELVDEPTARAIVALALAGDWRDLHRASQKVRDFSFEDREHILAVTDFITIKLVSLVAQGTPANSASGMIHLMKEMSSPLAERWAVFRHACAKSIALSCPTEQRASALQQFRRLWEIESRPHRRVALAIVCEVLHDPEMANVP